MAIFTLLFFKIFLYHSIAEFEPKGDVDQELLSTSEKSTPA